MEKNFESPSSEQVEINNVEWMRFALLSAGLGTWDMDPLNHVVIWDDRCRELYGFPKDHHITYEDVLNYIHPEDKGRVDAAVKSALQGHDDGHYDVRFRTIGATDNKLRWLNCKGKAYFNSDGVAFRFAGTARDITKELQEREMADLLLSLVENSPEYMAAANTEGQLFYMNSSGRKLLGVAEDVDISTINSKHILPSKDYAIAKEEIYTKLDRGEKWSGVIYIQHLVTRELIPCHADYVVIHDPVTNEVIGRGATLKDLRPELNAKKEQQKLLSLLENSRDFVSLSDEDGNITYVNAAGLKLVGLDDIYAAKRPNTDYVADEGRDAVMTAIKEKLAQDGHWSGEVHYRNFKTGEAIPVEAMTMQVYDPITGKAQGRATISRDLREEKAAQQQRLQNEAELERIVESRTSELKKANIDLNIVNQNLEQFAYVASHDLQEPLRKINMFSALLQEKYADQLNETGVRNLGIIRNAASRMTTLIQDLLAFSRVSRQEHLFEQVDLQQVVQQVITDFDILIQQKEARIESDPLCIVPGIPLHMTQLFHNLIGNALKFTKAGVPPVIQIRSRHMDPAEVAAHPQLQNGTPYCEIKISDNGIGFAPAYAKKIFVIFQRLHGRGEYEGSGIGLALCQKIVIAHHGVIYAESEEGQGATFVVVLPVYN
jgi:PAS domain S-box-containing protein